METLNDQTAHVWFVELNEANRPDLIRAYERLLSADEVERAARMTAPMVRHEFLVTRALVRTALSRYADVAPEAWVFTRNAYGRPELTSPSGVPPLRFNLSHSHGLAACLVALDYEVGIDVEYLDRHSGCADIARRFFSPSENALLRAASGEPERERQRFFELWTAKEAYIKAIGIGLSMPLDAFSIDVTATPVCISFAPPNNDDAAEWQFDIFHPLPRHTMTTAVRRGRHPPLCLELHRCLPLVR